MKKAKKLVILTLIAVLSVSNYTQLTAYPKEPSDTILISRDKT